MNVTYLDVGCAQQVQPLPVMKTLSFAFYLEQRFPNWAPQNPLVPWKVSGLHETFGKNKEPNFILPKKKYIRIWINYAARYTLSFSSVTTNRTLSKKCDRKKANLWNHPVLYVIHNTFRTCYGSICMHSWSSLLAAVPLNKQREVVLCCALPFLHF